MRWEGEREDHLGPMNVDMNARGSVTQRPSKKARDRYKWHTDNKHHSYIFCNIVDFNLQNLPHKQSSWYTNSSPKATHFFQNANMCGGSRVCLGPNDPLLTGKNTHTHTQRVGQHSDLMNWRHWLFYREGQSGVSM